MPTVRRDPHYFLPTTGDRHLLLGSDEADNERQLRAFFSERDLAAYRTMQSELAALREDLAPTWLSAPLSIEETAVRYVRAPLRQAFVDLCRKPVGEYLPRFGFESELLMAMYAVTDGFSGLTGTWNTPGTGMNFLVHNMCRLPGSDGTFMLVRGGMGAVSGRLAEAAQKAGARIETSRRVDRIDVERGIVRGVTLSDGTEVRARAVVCNADPFRMRTLVGDASLPAEYHARLDGYVRNGTTLKVNLALKGLPRFACLANESPKRQAAAWGPTIHLLPDEKDILGALVRTFEEVEKGRLPEFPTMEVYSHTTLDPSLQDPEGHHNAALFVQWVPYELAGTTWEAEEDRYVRHLLSICDRFAPGTSACVVDVFALPPPKIESHFGITRGHIHHVDNGFGFADRLPYATPVQGLYSCSAGCHPAGSVIGAAGHNAAAQVLGDMGKAIA
jgi:phytoene dehydrogenase-like protein